MKNTKNFIFLHLNIMLFSLTGVFSKCASNALNEGGIYNLKLYVFLGLMILNCGIYAIAWQRAIKKFDLSVAFANRSVYLIWSQIWAFFIFKEQISPQNIAGLLIILVGVLIIQLENAKEEKETKEKNQGEALR